MKKSCLSLCACVFVLTSQQAPDYRLYKSEPELTTVKEEVDEANNEDKGKDKTETLTENKEPAASKGTPPGHAHTYHAC